MPPVAMPEPELAQMPEPQVLDALEGGLLQDDVVPLPPPPQTWSAWFWGRMTNRVWLGLVLISFLSAIPTSFYVVQDLVYYAMVAHGSDPDKIDFYAMPYFDQVHTCFDMVYLLLVVLVILEFFFRVSWAITAGFLRVGQFVLAQYNATG